MEETVAMFGSDAMLLLQEEKKPDVNQTEFSTSFVNEERATNMDDNIIAGLLNGDALILRRTMRQLLSICARHDGRFYGELLIQTMSCRSTVDNYEKSAKTTGLAYQVNDLFGDSACNVDENSMMSRHAYDDLSSSMSTTTGPSAHASNWPIDNDDGNMTFEKRGTLEKKPKKRKRTQEKEVPEEGDGKHKDTKSKQSAYIVIRAAQLLHIYETHLATFERQDMKIPNEKIPWAIRVALTKWCAYHDSSILKSDLPAFASREIRTVSKEITCWWTEAEKKPVIARLLNGITSYADSVVSVSTEPTFIVQKIHRLGLNLPSLEDAKKYTHPQVGGYVKKNERAKSNVEPSKMTSSEIDEEELVYEAEPKPKRQKSSSYEEDIKDEAEIDGEVQCGDADGSGDNNISLKDVLFGNNFSDNDDDIIIN
jgi:hypothetical protein